MCCVVTPSTMQMLDEAGQVIRNSTTVGPLSEGHRFVSYCEARSGRPKPNVGWYLNGKRLTGNFLSTYFINFKHILCNKLLYFKLKPSLLYPQNY